MFKSLRISAVLLLACVLAACGGSEQADKAALELAARSLVPANSELAEVYNRSCRSCHTVAATGSPLTGDTAAWAPRMEKGMSTLVDNVINGFGGMPSFGLCRDCEAAQFEALILFMAEGG